MRFTERLQGFMLVKCANCGRRVMLKDTRIRGDDVDAAKAEAEKAGGKPTMRLRAYCLQCCEKLYGPNFDQDPAG